MASFTSRQQGLIGLFLLIFLVGTRGHHIATMQHLPSASWAVFFLAGIYLRPMWVLPLLLSLVFALDVMPSLLAGNSLAEVFSSGQAFCITPAYLFLAPAYASLWWAGRWFARRATVAWRTLLPLTQAMMAGAMACEVWSSGGFYWLSGRFAEPSLAEFGSRLLMYFPSSLQGLAFYVGLALLVHICLAYATGDAHRHAKS